MLDIAPADGVKVPFTASKLPPDPMDLVQVPPSCSPVIKLNKLIVAVLLLQTIIGVPSTPALGCALMVIVAVLVELTHGEAPKSV